MFNFKNIKKQAFSTLALSAVIFQATPTLALAQGIGISNSKDDETTRVAPSYTNQRLAGTSSYLQPATNEQLGKEMRAGSNTVVVRSDWNLATAKSNWNIKGGGSDNEYGFFGKTVNNEVAFCVQLGAPLNLGSNPGYTVSKPSTQEFQKMSLAEYYGYNTQPNLQNMWLTQNLIWELQGNSLVSAVTPGNYSAFKANVMANVNKFYTKPSFNGKTYTLEVNKPLTITDTKGSFANYRNGTFANNTGVKVQKSGNKVTITASNSSKDGNIKFKYNIPDSYSGHPMIFSKPGEQAVMVGRVDDPAITQINIKVQKKGRIRLHKQDSETGNTPQGEATLNGAEYALQDTAGKTLETLKVGKDNYSNYSKQYNVGNYQYVETKAPVGYNLDKTVHKITINATNVDGDLNSNSVDAKDRVIKGNVEIEKSYYEKAQTETGALKPLEGAIFDIYSKATGKKIQEQTTDKDGHAAFNNMPFGWYVVKEEKAPAGYIKVDDFEVNVDADGHVYKYDLTDKPMRYDFKMEKLNEKIDRQDNQGIHSNYVDNAKGAEFGLFDQDNKLVKKVTIDGKSKATFDGIVAGNYTLKEIKTSDTEHVLSKEVWHVEITLDGILITDSKGNKVDTKDGIDLIVKNEQVRGNVDISKVDATNNKELPGAKLSVTGDNNTNISWTSTNEQKHIKLADGHYTMHEVIAPKGYLKAQDVQFDVKDGKATKVVMKDNKPLLQTGQQKTIFGLVLLAISVSCFVGYFYFNKKDNKKVK